MGRLQNLKSVLKRRSSRAKDRGDLARPAGTQVPVAALSAGAVKARSRAAVGATRRGLDGAEHSAMLPVVMAGH